MSVGAGGAGDAQRAAGRGYWVTWVATLLFFAGFYTLLVPLPKALEAAGLADWQIGLVLGAFGLASVIGRPAAGLAVDRWGARPVMLCGALALVVGALGVPLAHDVVSLFGLRLLQAAGYVAFTTGGTSLAIALTPPTERGRRLAIFGAAANVSMTLAPAAASFLLLIAPLETAFLLSAGLALVAGLVAVSLRATPHRSEDRARTTGSALIGQLAVAMISTALVGAAFAAFFQFAPILADRRGGVVAGALYTAYGVAIILARLVGGRAIDRLGIGRTMVLAACLLCLGLGLTALAYGAPLLLFATLLIAIGSGLSHPALLAHHAALLPNAPGTATAAFYFGFDLGLGLGSWILGVVLELAGLAGLYAAGALFAALVLPLVPLLARQGRQRHLEGSTEAGDRIVRSIS